MRFIFGGECIYENPLLTKERLEHEKIQTTLGTYGHLHPNTNLEVANKLTGVLPQCVANSHLSLHMFSQYCTALRKSKLLIMVLLLHLL